LKTDEADSQAAENYFANNFKACCRSLQPSSNERSKKNNGSYGAVSIRLLFT